MIRTDSNRGRIALAIAHCAGLVDMVALPLWIGALIQHYRLDPQQAGLLVTLFLAGAVVASLVIAPLFHRVASGRLLATMGFAAAAVAFALLAGAADFSSMALFHALGGLSIGTALSMTHGTVARSANPHRLFAVCGIALGVFALVFLGSMPPIIASQGGPILFKVFAGVMALGAVAALLAFPAPDPLPATPVAAQQAKSRSATGLWAGIVGLCCMSIVQAMGFAFFERMGADSGYGVAQVTAVLATLGLVNLFPTALAAFLEKRWSARGVLMGGATVQALLVAAIYNSSAFLPYAIPGALFVAVMLFTHVFGFGLLARIDTTGRALAATPAMMMTGAAIGPVLGGTLVKVAGYPAIGWAALVIGAVALVCFSKIARTATPASAVGKPA
jgi:predicted MFS family arabinose efflux permease